MINPPEPPINDEARNDAHTASTGVRLHTLLQLTASPWTTETSTSENWQFGAL